MEKTGDSKTLSRNLVPPDPAARSCCVHIEKQAVAAGLGRVPAGNCFSLGIHFDEARRPIGVLRKSRDTGTIGASNAVVPPAAGGFPRVLKNHMSFGAPLGPKPAVEYCPLKLGTESMPGIPGSVACCVPVICGMPALPKGERLG
jgi:hypothetical protein